MSLTLRPTGRPRASHWFAAALFAALGLLAAEADAQEIDAATRSSARQLAAEGNAFYTKEDFAQAYERFSRAYQLVHTPTLGLWEARSLLRLGRWVEASERFLDVQRQPLAEGAPPEHQKAREDATVERQALLPRIPSLRVLIEGADPSEVSVTLNGEALPAPLVGVGRPVNPGKLAVKGTRGTEVVEANPELAEGETRDVTLAFQPPAPVLAPVPEPPPPVVPLEPEPPPPEQSGTGQRTLGYVTLGAGGVSVIVGSVFGILGLSSKSDLDETCPERKCPPSEYDALDGYETQRTLSIVGFTAGAVLAVGGAALILTAPSPSSERAGVAKRRLALRLGFGEASLFGELP